jgi:hypothetical protein
MANLKISALTASTTPLAGTEVLPIVQSSTTKQVSIANVTAGRAVSALNLTLTDNTTSLTASGGAIGKGIAFAGGQTEFITYGTTPLGIGTSGSAAFNLYTASVQAVNIDTSQNIKFGTGNLVQGTAAKGVNFTANTPLAGMTSQLLNWYEEGTFTPVIAGQATAGAGTYTSQVGRYTRIGSAVHFTVYVVWTAHTGTGGMVLQGMPFTSNATAGQYYQFAAAAGNLAYTATKTLQLLMFNNSTQLVFYEQAAITALTQINVDSAADVVVTGTYFV